MAKQEARKKSIEREYIINLREEIQKVPRYRKAEKAVKAVREFLIRHMKVYDNDPKKIKLSKWLNEYLWKRGIRNPPTRIKIKAIKYEDGMVEAELMELSKKAEIEKKKEQERKEEAEKIEATKAEEAKKTDAATNAEVKQEVDAEKAEEKDKSEKLKEEERLLEKDLEKEAKRHKQKIEKPAKDVHKRTLTGV
ncbi:MAG: 50S ribosomal protein L31e [archaeon]